MITISDIFIYLVRQKQHSHWLTIWRCDGVRSTGNEQVRNTLPRFLEIVILESIIESWFLTSFFWCMTECTGDEYLCGRELVERLSLDDRCSVFPAFLPFITWLRSDFLVALSGFNPSTKKKSFSMTFLGVPCRWRDGLVAKHPWLKVREGWVSRDRCRGLAEIILPFPSRT